MPSAAITTSAISERPSANLTVTWLSRGSTWSTQAPSRSAPGAVCARFEVAHAQAGGEAASLNTRAYTITVSSDGVNWTQAVAVSNNTAANTAHTVSGVSGRYVRLNVSAPTQNSGGATRIYELRVFT
jgi:hypothetical protein